MKLPPRKIWDKVVKKTIKEVIKNNDIYILSDENTEDYILNIKKINKNDLEKTIDELPIREDIGGVLSLLITITPDNEDYYSFEDKLIEVLEERFLIVVNELNTEDELNKNNSYLNILIQLQDKFADWIDKPIIDMKKNELKKILFN